MENPKIPFGFQAIHNPGALRLGDIVFCYNYMVRRWYRTVVKDTSIQDVTLRGIDGSYEGMTWGATFDHLENPHYYLIMSDG